MFLRKHPLYFHLPLLLPSQSAYLPVQYLLLLPVRSPYFQLLNPLFPGLLPAGNHRNHLHHMQLLRCLPPQRHPQGKPVPPKYHPHSEHMLFLLPGNHRIPCAYSLPVHCILYYSLLLLQILLPMEPTS